MTENDRVKELREGLDLTLEKFGKRMGVTKVAISNIERSKRNLTEQMISAICREFNVSEEWLRNGTGEMFNQLEMDKDTMYISNLLMDNEDNPFYDLVKEIMHTYVDLDSKSQKIIKETTKKLLDNLNKRED